MQNARCDRVQPETPWLRSQSSGVWVPPSCRAWACEVCGPRRDRRLARALDRAGYYSTVELTDAPSDARQGAARAAYLIRRATDHWEWAWTLEAGKKTGMVHMHAVVRGSGIDQSDLCHIARAAGWGYVTWIRKAEAAGKARYATKASYAAKADAGYPARLALNGTRPWHWSRGYTAGVPMRDWVREHAPSSDPGPWVVIPAPHVPGYDEWREWLQEAKERKAAAGEERRRVKAAQAAAEAAGIRQVVVQLAGEIASDDDPVEAARRRKRDAGHAMAGYRLAEWNRQRRESRELTSEATQTGAGFA